MATGAVVIKENAKGREGETIIIVGKNVSKKASERNLVKRRIRAVARAFLQGRRKGIVIIARPGAQKLPFAELRAEIQNKLGQE